MFKFDSSIINKLTKKLLDENVVRNRNQKEVIIRIIDTIYRFLVFNDMEKTVGEKISYDDVFNITQIEKNNNILFEFVDVVKTAMDLKDSEKPEAVTYLIKYIDNNIEKDLSLDRLADLTHLNASYLSRMFKKETGSKLSVYIKTERINRAKKFLLETDMKISEISEKIGFNSDAYFGNIFKKETGISPQKFKQQANTGKDIYNM